MATGLASWRRRVLAVAYGSIGGNEPLTAALTFGWRLDVFQDIESGGQSLRCYDPLTGSDLWEPRLPEQLRERPEQLAPSAVRARVARQVWAALGFGCAENGRSNQALLAVTSLRADRPAG
jgi:hypothetical protein